jgi:hypothetical protein
MQLQNSPFVKEGTINFSAVSQRDVWLDRFLWEDHHQKHNSIILHEDTVLRIELQPDYPLTLGKVVDKHGPPENVYAAVGGEGYVEYIVILDYPSKGLKYSSVSNVALEEGKGVVTDKDIGTVGEDMRVTLAVYFAPTSLEDALRNVFLYEEELVTRDLGSAQEWKGFGPVELDRHYPPRQ